MKEGFVHTSNSWLTTGLFHAHAPLPKDKSSRWDECTDL